MVAEEEDDLALFAYALVDSRLNCFLDSGIRKARSLWPRPIERVDDCS